MNEMDTGDEPEETNAAEADGAEEPETEEAGGGEEEADGAESAEGEDGAADEDEEGEGDDELGQRAQKRIKKLVGERKDAERRVRELERQLESAKKLGGDEGKAIIAAAEKAGVLASMLSKDLAEGLERLDQKERALKAMGQMLDTDDEEFQVGEESYSRRQIERREARLRDEVAELKGEFGTQRTDLQRRVKGIFELGLAAQKAGWRPGAKKPETKTKTIDRPQAGQGTPEAATRRRTRADFGAVESIDDLEAALAEMRRKGKKQ